MIRLRAALLPVLLLLLPVIAYAPALWEGRLLGPGDGAALHFPLRAAAWESWRVGDLPDWNPAIFLGTPLLAAYRPGVLFPLMLPLALLPPFTAFQVLVMGSLALSAVLAFAYVRRLGGEGVGAYFAGLSFALGPYLVGHLDDTATVIAAPLLFLLMIAVEAQLARGGALRAAGLAASLALLLLAGSPEADRAGAALLAGRLLVAWWTGTARAAWSETLIAIGAGALLAAPQLLPTVLAARQAGRAVTGLAPTGEPAVPGLTGLVLRYTSHTPAPSLALAALPLAASQTPIRVLGAALAICLALQVGRGPLSAPGALALVFDLTLSVLAGLSLSAQWRSRREAEGRRLRAYFLFGAVASALALSVAAATLGPLPQTLAGALGVLALALILYFPNASAPDPVRAGIWLLPLTVSFLLQPQGRRVWESAPTGAELLRGSATRESIDRVLGARRSEPMLTLASEWPAGEERDLGWDNLGPLSGRRNVNGYDPMVSFRRREALGGMGPGGTLPPGFLRSDPSRLEMLGIRWVQVPASALHAGENPAGDRLDVPVEAGRPRFLPLALGPATEVRLVSALSEAEDVVQETVVAFVHARLASGREISLPLRAGLDTAEWAWDRPDVRARVAHYRAPVAESWPAPDGSFQGHRYQALLRLPGRYWVDGIRLERAPGRGIFTLHRIAVFDAVTGRAAAASLTAGFVSDTGRFREAATTPGVRLFELPVTSGRAAVVEGLRQLPSEPAVLSALASLARSGVDAHREAVGVESDLAGVTLPPGSRASRAEVVRSLADWIDVRAEGPGLLVVTDGWDGGWRASLDDARARVLRVNHGEMGVVLPEGRHRVVFSYRPEGFWTGIALAGVGAAAMGHLARRSRGRSPGRGGSGGARRGPPSSRASADGCAPPPSGAAPAGPRYARSTFRASERLTLRGTACYGHPLTPSRPSLSIFFPAYNDAGTIASLALVAHMTARQLTDDYEVIVVDDGSPDHTGALLDEMAAHFPWLKVVHHGGNRGYGGALRTGFATAAKELVFYTDGDAQYDPRELLKLYAALGPDVDFVNGYKIGRSDPLHRVVIGRLYHTFVRTLFGLRLRDVDCDFRLMRRQVLDKVRLTRSSGVICVELMKKVQDHGFRIAEVPVRHYHRTYGKSQFFNFPRVGRTLVDLMRLWVELVLHKEHLASKDGEPGIASHARQSRD